MDFKGKVILITGASYGIGAAIANYFAELGSNIIITYNQSQDLSKKVVSSIKMNFSVEVDSLKCDITCENDVNNLFLFVKQKYGRLDILINNAALSIDSFWLDKSKGEFLKVLEVNVVGTFLMIKRFSEITSYIFNISSTDAFDTGSTYNLDYSCSKASINCMTRYLALFDKNTKYITLCPNWVDTEPIKEMNQEFLQAELKRIKQEKLINPRSIAIMIENCLVQDIESGSILRIDKDFSCE